MRRDFNQTLILLMQEPNAYLANANFLLSWHKLLIKDRLRINLVMARVQGTLVAETLVNFF